MGGIAEVLMALDPVNSAAHNCASRKEVNRKESDLLMAININCFAQCQSGKGYWRFPGTRSLTLSGILIERSSEFTLPPTFHRKIIYTESAVAVR
jgi:hypothetical protein